MKKAVIFAPFWGQAGHVGNYRVDRFVRWLAVEGFYIVLIRAGSVVGQRKEPWGIELTVRDSLGLYRDTHNRGTPVKTRKPNRLRRLMAYWLFNPDPSIVWSRAAASNPDVIEQAKGASFIISSSPPEAAHVGAAILAKKVGAKLIVDMRDGWLDEPLKQLLRESRLQRWREGRLEKSILDQADKIFVTSPVWKLLLVERLPFTLDKTVVLTNGYPPEGLFEVTQSDDRSVDEPIRLVHAGRFTGSMLTRHVSLLLKPLFLGFKGGASRGVITLLGRFERDDMVEIDLWNRNFEAIGWLIDIKAAIPRDEMMNLLCQADGLLLLAEKHAAIPAKIFEYLVVKKPILAVTPMCGAVWSVGKSLPQMFLADCDRPDKNVLRDFISACKQSEKVYEIPSQFSEKALEKIFINEILEKGEI